VSDKRHLGEIETILIAAMPTANSSRPRMSEIKIPKDVVARMKEIRRHAIAPVTYKDFSELRGLVEKLCRSTGRAK
jgi:thiamine pyrophosphate-dependent acetolactate synthase large subunit-like protein